MPKYPPTMPYRVLNFGAGVQSTALMLLMREKLIPRAHAAVFADTGWEPPSVYEHLERCKSVFESMEIPLHIVSFGNIRDDHIAKVEGRKGLNSMPFHVQPKGILRRICTDRYKIEPITRLIVGHMRKRDMLVKTVEQWFGISTDEAERERICQRKRWQFRYPLLYWRPMSRQQCIEYNASKGMRAPKSACIGCPYRSRDQWIELRKDPVLWKDAVDFDAAMRNIPGARGDCFIHYMRKPLEEAVLCAANTPNDMRQECSGMCGL